MGEAQWEWRIHDIVRLVDVNRQRKVIFDENEIETEDTSHYCFNVWNKSERCKNCTSSLAYQDHCQKTKFEFIDHHFYYVTSQYVTVDEKPYVLEIVQNISDATLEGAFGGENFINQMRSYTDAMYTDSLTKISNRRYYDDQIKNLEMDAVAMIDVDNFKTINDSFGHLAGDAALASVASVLRSSVRAEDSVIRYGGDEFLIAFATIPEDVVATRLHEILESVRKIRLEEFPDVRITISAGGAYGRDTTLSIMKDADEELYKAKETKNTVKVGRHQKNS